MINYSIFCDGAYSSVRKQGGAGIVILKNGEKILEYSNSYKDVTNNIMELGAIIVALRFIKGKIDSLTFYSDSMYCIGTITQGWQRKKNKKLWEEFDNQYNRVKELCPNIEFIHVRGHQKDDSEHTKWNNEVDRLAVLASTSI